MCDSYAGTGQHLGAEFVHCSVHGNVAPAVTQQYTFADDMMRHRVYQSQEGLKVCAEAWSLFRRHW